MELRPGAWPASLWALIRDWLRPPGSVGGALWKAFSIVSLALLLASAWMLWRYPEQVMERLLQRQETSLAAIFRRRPESQRQVMELLGAYVQEYQPTQIALIARHSAIGVEEIWANEATAGWPTATGGLMHENMQPALAAMLFELCWQGPLRHPSPRPRLLRDAPSPWLVCGLSDAADVRGYVLVHWQERSGFQRVRCSDWMREQRHGADPVLNVISGAARQQGNKPQGAGQQGGVMGARDWIAAVLLSAALVMPLSRALESNGPMTSGAAGLGGVYAMQASCRLAGGVVRACIKERRSGRILGNPQLVSELEKE